ncbi:MAG: hypothetical protein ACYS9X_08085 [Planctomycetota bacterium]|jgi:hypothetical protein
MRRGTKYGVIAFAGMAALVLAARAVSCLTHSHSSPNHVAAYAALRAYIGAQQTFRKKPRYGPDTGCVYANPRDGTGFPDLFRVGGPLERLDRTELKLIDLAFARATSPETPKAGYWFVEIIGDAVTGPYDYTRECGLCTVPAVYGVTGTPTYIVDPTGRIYTKDTHGTPVRVFPDVDREGWRKVGSDGP